VRKHAKDAPIWRPQALELVGASCHTRSFYKLLMYETPFKMFPSSHFLNLEVLKKFSKSSQVLGTIPSQLGTFHTYPHASKNVGTMETSFRDVKSNSHTLGISLDLILYMHHTAALNTDMQGT